MDDDDDDEVVVVFSFFLKVVTYCTVQTSNPTTVKKHLTTKMIEQQT